MPVGSYPFGTSPYGCLEMAGNVSEWCLNRRSRGFAAAGGSWGDIPYEFGRYGNYPGLYASDRVGFRCARSGADVSEQGAGPLGEEQSAPRYSPATEAEFRAIQALYRYDPTPLDARVAERIETPDYRREKILFAVANDKQAFGYLWLPAAGKGPYQLIHLVPSGGVYFGLTLQYHVDFCLIPFLRQGRGVFAVALEGYGERPDPPGAIPPDPSTVRFRDRVVAWTTDQRRGLDVVTARPEIDAERIAYFGISLGGSRLVFAAMEPRYRSVIMMSAGISRRVRPVVPEASPVALAPFIRAPKLMISGRYDEAFSLETEAMPLFALLSEPKEMVVFEGGHVPSPEQAVPVIRRFLDQTLGPVSR